MIQDLVIVNIFLEKINFSHVSGYIFQSKIASCSYSKVEIFPRHLYFNGVKITCTALSKCVL